MRLVSLYGCRARRRNLRQTGSELTQEAKQGSTKIAGRQKGELSSTANLVGG